MTYASKSLRFNHKWQWPMITYHSKSMEYSISKLLIQWRPLTELKISLTLFLSLLRQLWGQRLARSLLTERSKKEYSWTLKLCELFTRKQLTGAFKHWGTKSKTSTCPRTSQGAWSCKLKLSDKRELLSLPQREIGSRVSTLLKLRRGQLSLWQKGKRKLWLSRPKPQQNL